MRLVILGAGASIGTVGFPGVLGFGRTLHALHPTWRERWPALAGAVAETPVPLGTKVDDWRLDDVWTRIDYIAKLHPALSTGPYSAAVSTELHAAIAAVFGRVTWQASIAEDRTDRTLPRLLARFKASDSLVSFNWDTLAESVMTEQARAGGPRLVQGPCARDRSGVRFAKPHGSLAWTRNRFGQIADAAGAPNLKAVTAEEVEQDVGNQPLLLGAVPLKSELIKEVQGEANSWIYSTIMGQWRVLCEAVTEADELDVVGYSFPDEDTHGRLLFQEASHRRRCPWKGLNLFVPDDDQGKAVARRMERALLLPCGGIRPIGRIQRPQVGLSG